LTFLELSNIITTIVLMVVSNKLWKMAYFHVGITMRNTIGDPK